MRKFGTIFLLLCLLLSLAACGSTDQTTGTADPAPAAQPAPTGDGAGSTLVAYFSWAENAVLSEDVDALTSPSVVPPGNVQLLAADMVVFVTPLYYYGMSAQLKTMVDRFCAFNSSLQAKHLKSALLAAAWNSDSWTFAALEAHYQTLVRYLNLQDMGMVLGTGCGTPAMTARSPFPQAAYRLGRQLL